MTFSTFMTALSWIIGPISLLGFICATSGFLGWAPKKDAPAHFWTGVWFWAWLIGRYLL